jgi:hypothetical protein
LTFFVTSIFKSLYFLKWCPIFDNSLLLQFSKFNKGPFTNYVDKILACFDHLPPSVDIFYLMNIDEKSTFLDYLTPSSCKRSLWMHPNFICLQLIFSQKPFKFCILLLKTPQLVHIAINYIHGIEVIMPLQDSVVNEYGSISHHGHYSDNDPKKPTYSCCTALEKYMNGNDEECLIS